MHPDISYRHFGSSQLFPELAWSEGSSQCPIKSLEANPKRVHATELPNLCVPNEGREC
jgi:hypothetical protein